MILLGIGLTFLSRGFDGFASGFLIGAGITMMLLGVYVVSARNRIGEKGRRGWLPSRDGAE